MASNRSATSALGQLQRARTADSDAFLSGASRYDWMSCRVGAPPKSSQQGQACHLARVVRGGQCATARLARSVPAGNLSQTIAIVFSTSSR